jgi:hypothetical protein
VPGFVPLVAVFILATDNTVPVAPSAVEGASTMSMVIVGTDAVPPMMALRAVNPDRPVRLMSKS